MDILYHFMSFPKCPDEANALVSATVPSFASAAMPASLAFHAAPPSEKTTFQGFKMLGPYDHHMIHKVVVSVLYCICSWSVKMIHDVCVCVKAKKCAPDLLPAFASCPRLKKMKTDSWPQYIICNSFVIQKSGQIIAAPATVGQIQAWSRAPAEVGWMLWDISSSNPTWTSPADFGNGILQVFGLTWRDSRRKGIISSPSISCFRTKATSGGEKKGLWLVVSYEICDCICNTEVALLENLTRTVPHAPNAIESH